MKIRYSNGIRYDNFDSWSQTRYPRAFIPRETWDFIMGRVLSRNNTRYS